MLIRSLIPLTALALLASACGGSEPQNTPQPTAIPATATAPAASQTGPTATPEAGQQPAATPAPASGQQPAATPAPASGQQPAATPAPASGQQPAATPAPQQPAATPATGSGQDQTDMRKLNLDATPTNLKSYRIRFTFSFDGKLSDGEALKGTAEFLQEAIAETNEQRVRFSSTRQDAKKGEDKTTVDRFIVGNVNYYFVAEGDGQGQCISISSDAPTTQQLAIFKPSDLIGNPQGLRLTEQGVTVNGIRTDRYAVEAPDLKGEAWVAQEGDFVVKYTGEFSGKTPLFDGADGKATWEYQLEPDAVSKIELPEACIAQKPADDIPVPASATDKSQFGNVISFRSSESPQKVADFYKAEMPKLGWTQRDASEAGDLFLLTFTKDGRTVNITVNKNKEGTGSGVLILVEQK
jgi:hypothetical protein